MSMESRVVRPQAWNSKNKESTAIVQLLRILCRTKEKRVNKSTAPSKMPGSEISHKAKLKNDLPQRLLRLADLKARECTVLTNTLHKAARLQKLWLSKMFDQGLLQQSRKDAQRMLSKLSKSRQKIRRTFGENSGKHDFLFPHLFHCFHGRVALDSHAHLLRIAKL